MWGRSSLGRYAVVGFSLAIVPGHGVNTCRDTRRSTAGVLGFWPVDQDNTGARRTEHVELAAHLGDRSVQRGMARGGGVDGALHADVDADSSEGLPVKGGELVGLLVVAGDDSRCHAHQSCPTRRPSAGLWQ